MRALIKAGLPARKLPMLGWATQAGDLRIIYYWDAHSDTVYMLLAYKKNGQEDLPQDRITVLSRLIKEWLE